MPVLLEYFASGLVPRMPTWVFALAMLMMSIITFTAGLILDSVSRARTEQLRLHYISTPSRAMPVESVDIQEAGLQSAPRIVRERRG